MKHDPEVEQDWALEGLGWGAGGDEERIARVSAELRAGFAALRDVEPAVSLFGSARSRQDSAECVIAREVAREVARVRSSIASVRSGTSSCGS